MRATTREGWREKGKHVRMLNATEGLLFVVLWGGNEASEEGEETRKRERVGTVHWQRPERQADLLSQPAEWGLSYQTSSTVIQLMLLRRKPAQKMSNSYGKRLNTVQ